MAPAAQSFLICCDTASPTEFPQVILDVERVELSISAGLQDRVVQVWFSCWYF